MKSIKKIKIKQKNEENSKIANIIMIIMIVVVLKKKYLIISTSQRERSLNYAVMKSTTKEIHKSTVIDDDPIRIQIQRAYNTRALYFI